MKKYYFSSALRKTLQDLQLTQQVLATKAGITQSAIANLLSRNNRIKPQTLDSICKVVSESSKKHSELLLLEHLRDEVMRSGFDPASVEIRMKKTGDSKVENALVTLRRVSSCSKTARELLLRLADVLINSAEPEK